MTYDDYFMAVPGSSYSKGDEHPQFGQVVDSPGWLAGRQPLSFSKVLEARDIVFKEY